MGYGKLSQAGTAFAPSLGTAQSATGQTSVTFTGISFNQRLEIIFDQLTVSTNANAWLRFGDDSGIATSGYKSCSLAMDAPVSLRRFYQQSTTEFPFNIGIAGRLISGRFVLNLIDPDTFLYSFAGFGGQTTAPHQLIETCGQVTLSGLCTQFQVLQADGAAFTSGSINYATE